MPFTLAHAVATLPFKRSKWIVVSAFVFGTFGPDLEYFFRFAPRSRYGHNYPGFFYFTIPVAFLLWYLFERWLKRPLSTLLPRAFEERVQSLLEPFEIKDWKMFLLVVFSIFLGAGTHIVWDSFTHANQITFALAKWWYRGPTLPLIGYFPPFRMAQHASTILGSAILAYWLKRWMERTPPIPVPTPLSERMKLWIIITMSAFAVILACARTYLGLVANIRFGRLQLIVLFGVSVISFFALQLVLYCIWRTLVPKIALGGEAEVP